MRLQTFLNSIRDPKIRLTRCKTATHALDHALKQEVAKQTSKGHLRVRQAEVGKELIQQSDMNALVRQVMEKVKKVSISEDVEDVENWDTFCAPAKQAEVLL